MTSQAVHTQGRYYQFIIENQVLNHVKAALRKTLASREDLMGLDRKVSTVRFVTESLVRHLHRLLDMEDDDQEQVPVNEIKPHLVTTAAALQAEHMEFRQQLNHLAEGVSEITPENEPQFDEFCKELLAFLDRLDKHESAELQMLQELHNSDVGGEG